MVTAIFLCSFSIVTRNASFLRCHSPGAEGDSFLLHPVDKVEGIPRHSQEPTQRVSNMQCGCPTGLTATELGDCRAQAANTFLNEVDTVGIALCQPCTSLKQKEHILFCTSFCVFAYQQECDLVLLASQTVCASPAFFVPCGPCFHKGLGLRGAEHWGLSKLWRNKTSLRLLQQYWT